MKLGKYTNKSYISTINRSDMFYWQCDRPFNFEETQRIFLDRWNDYDENLFREMFISGLKNLPEYQNMTLEITSFTPIKRGSVNFNIQVTINNTFKIHGRFHPKGIPNGYFYSEKAATDSARENGVPTFKVLYVDDTLEKYPYAYMLTTVCEGEIMKNIDFEGRKDLEKNLVIDTGYLAAKINSIKTDGFGFFNNEYSRDKGKLVGIHPNFKKHFNSSLDESIKYLVDQKVIDSQKAQLIQSIFSKSEDVLNIQQGYLIHNDIADWNEVVDVSNSRVTGITDWDETFSGDPVMELAAWNLFFDGDRFDWFKEGYLKYSETFPDGYEVKMPLYKLRYVIAKATLRQKKINYHGMVEMLAFAIKTLDELLIELK